MADGSLCLVDLQADNLTRKEHSRKDYERLKITRLAFRDGKMKGIGNNILIGHDGEEVFSSILCGGEKTNRRRNLQQLISAR